MSIDFKVPVRLTNSPGEWPDAEKWMTNYDWLSSMVIGAFIQGGGIEGWAAGTSFTNPSNNAAIADNWTYLKSGTSPATCNVAREATNIDTGTYAAKFDITVAGSSDSLVGMKQDAINVSRLRGLTVGFGMAVKTLTGSKARLKIYDGTSTQYSEFHTGSGNFEVLTVKLSVAAAATTVTVYLEITANATATYYADSAFLYVVSSLISDDALGALGFHPALQAGQLFSFADGAVGSPGIFPVSDPDTGFYWVSSGIIGFSANGSLSFQMGPSAVLGKDGSNSLPGYGFISDPDCGMFRIGTNAIGLAVNAVTQVSLDATGGAQIKGTTTNDDASSGWVGEYVVSTVGNTAAPTSNQWGDMTSISLTAGDWDVTLTCATNNSGSTVTDQEFGIGTTSGNNSPGASQALDFISNGMTANQKVPMFLRKRFKLTSTTTVYAKFLYTWSGGSVFGLGSLQARRIR